MSKKNVLIGLSLAVSLFIYLFYRTEKTVVNALAIRLLSASTYKHARMAVSSTLPLHDIGIYSLPEALWIFCITATSMPYYPRLPGRRIPCMYLPLVFCLSLELCQLFHVTNGRFDSMDIALSLVFWGLARYQFSDHAATYNIAGKINTKTLACLFSYGIVYLAHVMK